MAGLEGVLFLISYAYSPRGYAALDKALIVKRLIGNVRIPLDDIREARMATADDLSGCIRLWGSGGLFGWYGLFRTSKLGKCTWYVTNRGNAVVLVTSEKTAVVSPDDVDGFLGTIRTAVPKVAPRDLVLEALGTYRSGSLPGTVIGLAVGLVGILVAAFAMFYAPGLPSAAGVDVAGIRVVNLAADTDWQPTRRTNRFANEHYHAGWFRVAGGRTVRIYRADGKRLVLLPPAGNGTAVLLETGDPERFVREVKQEWSGRS